MEKKLSSLFGCCTTTRLKWIDICVVSSRMWNFSHEGRDWEKPAQENKYNTHTRRPHQQHTHTLSHDEKNAGWARGRDTTRRGSRADWRLVGRLTTCTKSEKKKKKRGKKEENSEVEKWEGETVSVGWRQRAKRGGGRNTHTHVYYTVVGIIVAPESKGSKRGGMKGGA